MSDRLSIPPTPPRIIGLTGGIATGKTTVANYLADVYHLPILDADIYAREAVQPESAIFHRIVERYGTSIVLPDGTLNRPELGKIIFSNIDERRWLEAQIHPFVRDRLISGSQMEMAKSADKIVMVVPLLFEAQMTDLVTEIWVVNCPLERQVQRLMLRDRLSNEQAMNRINSQMPLSEKCDRADIVLDNSSTLESLLLQVDSAIIQD
jgi:dephospho-CoA kinase